MAVYLGTAGIVYLGRVGDRSFESRLDAADVNPTEKRFSFDFPVGTFVTGDKIVIERVVPPGATGVQLLDFVQPAGWGDNQQHRDGAWYVNVDAVGGIRLYHTWSEALSGAARTAIGLKPPSGSYPIKAALAESTQQCLGQIVEYSFSTAREAIDTTALGDAFKQQVSGLVSGQGEVQCLWDWRPPDCGDETENAHYFHQLVLRQQLGSKFRGNFFLKRSDAAPVDQNMQSLAKKTALFYDVDCIVTDVAIAFNTSSPVMSTIRFVTTGNISLRFEVPVASHILQENNDRIYLEDKTGYLGQENEF
jgi:hypothetical protein